MKWTVSGLVVACGALAFVALLPIDASAQKKPFSKPSAAPSFDKDVAAVVTKYCAGCHTGDNASGGVKFPSSLTATGALKSQALWANVAKNVASMHMPPQGMKQPTPEQRRLLVQWVDQAVKVDCRLADPGRVTIRRLNREEYNNTIRDLTGLTMRPADDFPSDDVGYGFDNIGDVLSLSPLLVEKYRNAAEKVVKAAIRVPKIKTQTVIGDALKSLGAGGQPTEGKYEFASVGQAKADFSVKSGGWYRVKVVASADLAGPELPKMKVLVNRDELATVEVKTKKSDPQSYEYPIRLGAGDISVTVGFLNDFYEAAVGNKKAQDRNLYISSVELVGPIDDAANVPPSQLKIIGPKPILEKEDETAKTVFEKFASRAYRRPVSTEEVDRLMNLYKLGKRAKEPFESCIQLGIQAILCSPNFLYRVELDAKPKDPKSIRGVNNYELASRLSYFLWSSMPDDQLMSLAKTGDLKAQILRMIRDDKAAALVDNFGMQWLQVRKLPNFQPDKKMFPDYNEALMRDMMTETRMYFTSVMLEDRPITDFIDSRYTYINESLAKLYGIPGISGSNFRKVGLVDPNRGGVLMQASVLTINSNPTRTSPTKRGKWILEQILGTPPPPPPPGVGILSEEKHFTSAMTLRQRMEEHRKNPACAACHLKMDAMGFGMENFDAIGKWRTKDGDFKIDATAAIPGGKSFKTPSQLKQILLTDKASFAKAFTEKMLTYALGRGLEPYDKCAVDDIAKVAGTQDYRFTAFVKAIVMSEPFRKRRGDAGQ